MSTKHEVLEEIHDKDAGLVAVIYQRTKPNGYRGFSYTVFKLFERTPGALTERTVHLNDRHLGAHRRLLNRIEERIDIEKDRIHSRRRHA